MQPATIGEAGAAASAEESRINVPSMIERASGGAVARRRQGGDRNGDRDRRALGDRMIEGLVIAPASIAAAADATALRSRVMSGAHPLPDASSVAAAHAALEFVARAQPGNWC